MTAIVGALNRHGIAIAADSAVTFNGSKVVNSGKKVFMLSKSYPVGIATYNQLDFLSIPWEIIIKMYRSVRFKNQTPPFDTLKEYVDDFCDYLRGFNFYFTTQRQQQHLQSLIYKFIRFVFFYYEQFDTDASKSVKDRISTCLAQLQNTAKINGKCDEFNAYTRAEFDTEIKPTLENQIDNVNNVTLKLSGKDLIDIKSLFSDAYYDYFTSKIVLDEHTGLIFFGYGDKEIFPSLIPINITLFWNGKLRCYVDDSKTAIIDDKNQSSLQSFAQTDVADSLVSGIDAQLAHIFYKTYRDGFKEFAGIVGDLMEQNGVNKVSADNVRNVNVDLISQKYWQNIQSHITSNYVSKFIGSIALMGKEDMAELAQSLVSLTGLKRHVTENIETVGGPVDVAIVSKSDGFIWIKRKHYFDPKLNSQFFELYNRI